jgi:hypothetical protein
VSAAQALRAPGWTAALAFAAALAVYLASGSAVPDSHDTTANAYLPVSLLSDGDLAFSPLEAPFMFLWGEKRAGGVVLVNVQSWAHPAPGSTGTFADEYRAGRLEWLGPRYYLVPTKREREATGEPLFASAFGVATGLTALPAAAIATALGADLHDAYTMFRAAKSTAAALVAGSAAFVFLTALGFLARAQALALAGLYAFGTCVWTISAQALWQQTAEIFFLSAGVLCVVRGETVWTRGLFAGLALSAAAACRPTAAVVWLAAAAYLAIAERRCLSTFLLAALPVGLASATYNLHYFGSPLDFGQLAAGAAVAQAKTGSPDLWQTPLWLGAAGLLLSPSRGLLVYTPFLAAAFVGGFLAWRAPRYAPLRFLTIAVPLLWLPAFAWFDWWGGWTYGYRPIVDTAPLLALLCIPALERLRRPAVKTAFVAAAAWSVFVQALGAAAYTPAAWNALTLEGTGEPANIDLPQHRHRLWSFRDWQIGYLIAHGRAGAAR